MYGNAATNFCFGKTGFDKPQHLMYGNSLWLDNLFFDTVDKPQHLMYGNLTAAST